MGLRCTVVTARRGLERLAPAWSALLGRSATDEPMLAPAWLLAWWRVFGPEDGRRLHAVALWGGDRLVGLAPLLLRRHWHRPGIPFRRLELLGSGEDEADEICSEYLNVVAERGAEEGVARALASALAGGALGGWDELVLPVLDGTSAMPELLAGALRREGIRAELTQTGAASYIPLPTTWDQYLQQLPSSHRYVVNRSMRDFEKWAAGTARVEVAATREQAGAARRVLEALHAERWTADGREGVFASPRFTQFHASIQPDLLAAGVLELMTVSAHGEPVAALYNLVWRDKVYFYQCGRKLDVPKGVRPGVVAHAFAIRRAIAEGRREYDFLGGNSRYKAQLAVATRPLVKLRAVRGALLERVRGLAEGGIHQARKLRDALREQVAAR